MIISKAVEHRVFGRLTVDEVLRGDWHFLLHFRTILLVGESLAWMLLSAAINLGGRV
jgi:hypothetical protein